MNFSDRINSNVIFLTNGVDAFSESARIAFPKIYVYLHMYRLLGVTAGDGSADQRTFKNKSRNVPAVLLFSISGAFELSDWRIYI